MQPRIIINESDLIHCIKGYFLLFMSAIFFGQTLLPKQKNKIPRAKAIQKITLFAEGDSPSKINHFLNSVFTSSKNDAMDRIQKVIAIIFLIDEPLFNLVLV